MYPVVINVIGKIKKIIPKLDLSIVFAGKTAFPNQKLFNPEYEGLSF